MCKCRCLTYTGGFFDGKTSVEQRREYLLNILRSEERQRDDGGDADSKEQQLSDDELNRLLARGSTELGLFQAQGEMMPLPRCRLLLATMCLLFGFANPRCMQHLTTGLGLA